MIDHRIQDIGDRAAGFGFAVIHFLNINGPDACNQCGLFALRRDQTKTLLQFFSCILGLVAADIISVNTLAIRLDTGGQDMDMGMAGIMVLIDQVGLRTEADFFNISHCNLGEFTLCKFLGRIEV